MRDAVLRMNIDFLNYIAQNFRFYRHKYLFCISQYLGMISEVPYTYFDPNQSFLRYVINLCLTMLPAKTKFKGHF